MNKWNRAINTRVLFLVIMATACGQATPQTPTSMLTDTALATAKSTDTLTPTTSPTSTTLPHNVPPVIVLNPAEDGLPGQRIILDASETFDYDGDTITFAWSQLHNPDRYTGLEYMTGNDAKFETTDTAVTAFTPEWPGIYRFSLAATDKDGTSSKMIDVVIRPLTVLPIRGVGISWWFGDDSNNAFPQVLDRLSADGVNWIQLNPIWCQKALDSNDVHPCSPEEQEPITDDQLIGAIHQAHAAGFRVLLKPHIYITNWQAGWQIRPPQWDSWFATYTNYLVYMARLAEAGKVEIFSVGTELASTHTQENNWRSAIDEVRKVYTGKLTYSDLCIQRPMLCARGFPAWDKLDYIGVSFYYNGTCSSDYGCQLPGEITPASTNPSVNDMTTQIDRELASTIDLLQKNYGLPVIATEIGIQNVDGANYEPAGSDSKVIDNREQADWYEASLQAISKRSYWQGYFWWTVDPLPQPFAYDNTVPKKSFDPRFKPAEQVLELWFGIK